MLLMMAQFLNNQVLPLLFLPIKPSNLIPHKFINLFIMLQPAIFLGYKHLPINQLRTLRILDIIQRFKQGLYLFRHTMPGLHSLNGLGSSLASLTSLALLALGFSVFLNVNSFEVNIFRHF